jgi:hypothetical protein
MSVIDHTVAQVNGAPLYRKDVAFIGVLADVVTSAGGGAGLAVTKAITGLSLPPTYTVNVIPDQDAVCKVTAKTQSGFTITLYPRLAANTLSAGHVDVQIVA